MERSANPNLHRSQFQKLDAQLHAEGGFSHPITGGDPEPPGFMVSDPGAEARFNPAKTRRQDPERGYEPSRLPQYVRSPASKAAFQDRSSYFGGWKEDHPSGGSEVVLDRSRKYGNLQEANKAMRRRPPGGGPESEQESGFNLTNRTYVYNVHHPRQVHRIWENIGSLGQ